ncbi:MAG: arylsulfatase [Kiritimatiellaeota bacterium]|nr:arylsulfatase [Kiritimatiellota bacterium]
MKRLSVCFAVLAVLGGPSLAAAKPNVIVILTDDIGYGDVGCYGARPEQVRTPQIDRLAKEGLRFTDGHAPSSSCTPSRYSLLTGDYAFRNPRGWGVLPGDAPLAIRPGSITLPAMFRQAGYATGLVGKWHLGLAEGGDSIQWNGEIKPGPLEIGFDEAFFLPATNDRVPTVYVKDHRVVNLDPADPIRVCYDHRITDEPTGQDQLALATVLKGLPNKEHLDAITAGVSRIGFMSGGRKALWKDEEMCGVFLREALAFLEKHKNRPFFLYYAPHNIHEPRVPHPRFRGTSGVGVYGDQIQELDDAVGQVLQALDRLRLADNTLIVFSSDNGGTQWQGYDYGAAAAFNGHQVNGALRGTKATVYEGGTRVPLIVRWPGHVPAGQTSPALVSLTDLPASFARLLGVVLPEDAAVDSMDVLEALLGKSETGRRELFEHGGENRGALRDGNWKFINGQLFDLTTDLSESHNLTAQQPARARAMAARLEAIRTLKKTRP